MESILYSYYVWMGIYGLFIWHKSKVEKEVKIIRYSFKSHLLIIIVSLVLTFILGFFFERYTDAALPYLDSLSTIFAFAATYLEAKKVLATWYYWIPLNAFSAWLYAQRGLDTYMWLMIVYVPLSIYGLYQWRKAANNVI